MAEASPMGTVTVKGGSRCEYPRHVMIRELFGSCMPGELGPSFLSRYTDVGERPRDLLGRPIRPGS